MILDCYCQGLICGRETRHWAVSTRIWDFPNISWFPNFRNSWGNSYTKFVMLNIKFRFTCGHSDLYWNIVKFQNIMIRIVGWLIACRQIILPPSNYNFLTFCLWRRGYHYCTTSFYEALTQVLGRFKSCSRRVGDSRWWGSLTMVPAGNKAKRLSSVNHTTITIHHQVVH